MQMIVNQTLLTLAQEALKLSTIDWLRTKRQQKATKEGCGSGDCGACTVIVGELTEATVSYYTANACLLPIQSLEGKALVTLEGVNALSDALHPAQQALVDCHGTQCGFCTPGFVMSLVALYLNHDEYPGREVTLEALSGNLCRCTGYQPILEAAEQMFSYPKAKWPDLTETLTQLTAADEQVELNPKTLEDYFEVQAKYPDALIAAGATDVGVAFTQALKEAPQRLFIGQINELTIIEETDDELTIGAAVPFSRCLPPLLSHYPEARELFSRLGSMQIRNLGTFGGSLGNASPIGDPLPFLLAVDATINLASTDGSRNVKATDFFLGFKQTALKAREIIQSVNIPLPDKHDRYFFYKLSQRYEDDISTLCMALKLRLIDEIITDVSVAFGGMAAIPKRATSVESALLDSLFSFKTIEQAAGFINNDFTPLTDVRSSSKYRLQAAKNLLLRAYYETQDCAVRIHHA